jgi:hypothetical protein
MLRYDLHGELDALTAKALRSLDLAGTIAAALQNADPSPGEQRSIERALTVRAAIVDAGIKLPAPRTAPDPEEELPRFIIPGPEEAPDMNRDSWTVREIAAAAGIHRITVVRHIRAIGGEIAAKHTAAARQGATTRYTLAEALQIMNAGGAPR